MLLLFRHFSFCPRLYSFVLFSKARLPLPFLSDFPRLFFPMIFSRIFIASTFFAVSFAAPAPVRRVVGGFLPEVQNGGVPGVGNANPRISTE